MESGRLYCIIGAAITSITTKTGIDLGNENQFQMYYIPKPCFYYLERKND
jgi:hypothetical protein